jgi:exodeoxyribonuclease VII small subunit
MATNKTPNLDEALQKLSQIVDDLSNQNVSINDGLKKFKQGADLLKVCNKELKKAENEFIKIKEDLEKNLD